MPVAVCPDCKAIYVVDDRFPHQCKKKRHR